MKWLADAWRRRDRVLRTVVQAAAGAALVGAGTALMEWLGSVKTSDYVVIGLTSAATVLVSALMNYGRRLQDEALDTEGDAP
jgi:uncharacterized membrane protein YhiD involved in acid resistance